MSVWQGTKKRWQEVELTAADLTGKDVATAFMALSVQRDAFVFSFVNNTNAEVQIMFVNPDNPDQTKERFTGLAPGFGFSSETVNAGGVFTISAQTKIYVHALGQAVSTGKVRLFIWG